MTYTIDIPDWAVEIYSDFSDWERHSVKVSDVTQNGVWSFELPNDAYFEYCFVDEQGKMRPDPNNDSKADSPWYPAARVIQGPDYQAHSCLYPEKLDLSPLERYKLDSIHLQPNLAESRRVMSYSPKGFEEKELPIVYVQDGVAYARAAQLPLVLETLLKGKKVKPAHFVFIEPQDRSIEYPYTVDYQQFVIEEVLPTMEEHLSFDGTRIAMGASLGGLVSGLLAWNYPEHFQTVVTQSGAFLGSPTNMDYYGATESWLLEQIQKHDADRFPNGLSWYVDCGNLEWLQPVNQDIAQALEAKGYQTKSHFRNAGHNWVNWRNGLADALIFALK